MLHAPRVFCDILSVRLIAAWCVGALPNGWLDAQGDQMIDRCHHYGMKNESVGDGGGRAHLLIATLYAYQGFTNRHLAINKDICHVA